MIKSIGIEGKKINPTIRKSIETIGQAGKFAWLIGKTAIASMFGDAIREIGTLPAGRSLIDLVLSGHAHCLEHLYTKDTGRGDSYIDWIVCGGSGHSLRRQRREGTVIYQNADLNSDPIGQSQLYVGRNGSGQDKKRPYSFLRIDVETVDRPKFTVKPYIAEWHQRQWHEYAINSFVI